MKIKQMHVTPVAIADAPLRNSVGVHEPYVNRVIVELVGEDGKSGFGEASYSTKLYEDLLALREQVVGADALNTNRLYEIVSAHISPPDAPVVDAQADPALKQFDLTPRRVNSALPRTFSPIEVAALDLGGHALGLPVAEMLGGRVRDSAPFSAYLFYKYAGGGGEGADLREDVYGEALTPDQVVQQAKDFIDRYGFKSIKLKAGVFEPMVEADAIIALRDAFGPDMPLRIDPNAAWTVETSIAVGEKLAGTLEYFEDPTPGIDGMSAVRKGLLAKGIDLPNATNMCVTSFDDIPELNAKDAVQVILGDHHYWGGLRAVVELGRICSTYHLGLSMHSNSHLGVSLMAMTHLAAATPGLTYDADTHYPWLYPADDIVQGGPIRFVDGAVPVPTTPGLGIEIDRDALARGKERFDRIPYRDRDDTTYMRKVYDPTYEKLLPRW
ncbi:MAG: enolase C-terminal domain-like protein [Thermomicrobiales bacterium]